MDWTALLALFLIAASPGVLLLLAAIIRNRILWNRMKARHRREREEQQQRMGAMLADLDRQWQDIQSRLPR